MKPLENNKLDITLQKLSGIQTLQLRLQFEQVRLLPELRTSKANVAEFKWENAWGALKNFTVTSELPHLVMEQSVDKTKQNINKRNTLSRIICLQTQFLNWCQLCVR